MNKLLARAISIASVGHEKQYSKITRLKGVKASDLERMEKYHKAFLYLNK